MMTTKHKDSDTSKLLSKTDTPTTKF